MTDRVVYDVAASSSGALGILEDCYEEALRDNGNSYVFLTSTDDLRSLKNVEVRSYPWVKTSWFHRLFFDWIVGPRIVRQIKPSSILSLQNTVMPRVCIPQIVYEHNCLPKAFCETRFSLLQEPNLWIRQNILGGIITRSLKKADAVVVQSQWMKERCVKKLGIPPQKVSVRIPQLKHLPEHRYPVQRKPVFFYPATCLPFKNHQLILEACRLLNSDISADRYKIIFTLSGSENNKMQRMKKTAEEEGLPIEFAGWKSREEVYLLYSQTTLLFVSELESLALPLYEAKRVGAPIIAPDQPYAHEALDGESSTCWFFRQNDPISLCSAMKLALKCISS